MPNVASSKSAVVDEKSKSIIIDYFKSDIDVILSDMASNTTGNKSLDSIRTNELCLDVLDFSKDRLSKDGVVISKLFMGKEFNEIKIKAKKNDLKRGRFYNKNSLDYLPSIFFFKSARPAISPRVVFSEDSDFLLAALIFFCSSSLKIAV